MEERNYFYRDNILRDWGSQLMFPVIKLIANVTCDSILSSQAVTKWAGAGFGP